MADDYNQKAGDAERREERSTGRTAAAEVDGDECEIRGSLARKTLGMLSEGAEGSPIIGQSRKRLLHDRNNEYNHESFGEVEREVSRANSRNDIVEMDVDECQIRRRRNRLIRESPGMLSEGAEGSPISGQSRKRLLHNRNNEYNHESFGEVEREVSRANSRNDIVEMDVDECQIRRRRNRLIRESPGMLSEGAEGSPISGQSRKRLLHNRNNKYDPESFGRRVSRSRTRLQNGYGVARRRRRSRSASVQDYREDEPSKRVSRCRSRARRDDEYVRHCSSTRRYRRMESRYYARSGSSDEDRCEKSKRKRLYSRSPGVEYARGPIKVSRKVRPDNDSKVSDRLSDLNVNIVSKFLDVIKDMKGQSSSKLSVNNVLPEFDPMSKEQTILMWLTKVEECAEIYGWNERETIHFALPKLAGVAKSWYQGLSTVLYSWSEWKKKLVESFPSREDYAEVLLTMLAKKVRYGDSLEHYYYAKMNLLNRCSIRGHKAVDCLLNGIEDRAVRVGAQAAGFCEPEEVLKYLKTVKVGVAKEVGDKPDKQRQDQNPLKSSTTKRPEGSESLKNFICHNCNENGHKSFKCDKPLASCATCSKRGHLPAFCWFNRDGRNVKSQRVGTTKDEGQIDSNVTNHAS